MRRLLLYILLIVPLCSAAQHNQLTNIPTIYIDTHNAQPVISKSEYIFADMVYVSGSDTLRYDSLRIRGRGNSTWGLAKKPYRIKFNESTRFLGEGHAKNKSWTLLANHADKSLLRNAVTSQMGEFLGLPFNPAAHFVDLVLNGTYLGNYQVSDQVNVDKKRVEIHEQDYVADEQSNITGGYLLEIDGFASSEPVYFTTSRNILVTVKSPDEDYINDAQLGYIRDYLNSFESALFAYDFTDPETGYRAMIDSTTLVAWYIATELSANVDGFWSTYIYKDQDDPKIYFGPLWDYDIAYNNSIRAGDVTEKSMVSLSGFGEGLAKVWARRFIQDPWFNEAVNDAWRAKNDEGVVDFLCSYIDSMALHIDESQELNYSRYSISSKVYDEIFIYSTYSEYISQLKEFIRNHASYLTGLFRSRVKQPGGETPDPDPEQLNPFELDRSHYYRIYNRGNNKALDIAADNGVVIWSVTPDRNTQLWRIEQAGDCYRLVNRETELALNDPSGEVIATQLNLVPVDDGSDSQLWRLVTVNENSNYNFINAGTGFVMNNSAGGSADGNHVVSYTNDERNSVSDNRQWRAFPEEPVPDYLPDEVKAMLQATIEECNAFLASLSGWAVGGGPFLYDSGRVEALRRAVADASSFESTVSDDYILQNVNLTARLSEARMVNAPLPSQQFVLRHRNSGLVLNLTTELTTVEERDAESAGQRFMFAPSAVEGKFTIKSASGLYLSLGNANQWHMYGYEEISDNEKAAFTVVPMDGYYRIYALNGVFASTYTDAGSKVYGDKQERELNLTAYGEWLLEEYVTPEEELLAQKAAELTALLQEAHERLAAIPHSWVGNAPMQHSPGNVDALTEMVALIGAAEYATVEEFDAALLALNSALERLSLLNAPDADKLYNLRHVSGMNLSAAYGITLEVPDNEDSAQQFRLVAVEGEPNCYNIFSNGIYLSVTDSVEPMFMLAETPRGENGRFLATQVADSLFTLTGVAGLVGADAGNGDAAVVPDMAGGEGTWWRVVEVSETTGIDAVGYERSVDYAVRYDRVRQTISFVSHEMEELSGTDVRIYTTGGRLLYTFDATKEHSLAELPRGTYIVQWRWAGSDHSVKFLKE